METVEISRDKAVRATELSRTTLANGVALGAATLRELIGRELGNNPDIDIEDHLTLVIGEAISKSLGDSRHAA